MVKLSASSLAILAAHTSINKTTPPIALPQELQQSWSGYSTWFPAKSYVPPPAGCEVVQVNLLQRHGARYPTQPTADDIQQSVQKIKQAKQFTDKNFEFIKTYTDTLGANDLVPYGAAQSFDAGQEHFVRYGAIVNATTLPFIRSTGSDRVVNSARNWSAGFAYASDYKYDPELSLIIPETSSSNNTLNTNCPNIGSSTSETDTWTDVFTPSIVARFNAAAPGTNLNGSDIANLMSLCPFDTVADEVPSKWCGLFSSDEWASYEYLGDLSYYYSYGYGQKLGRVQGVGYVNELLARLTGQPVQDETQTNHTLDDSPVTFPLDRTFYADFTHDVDIIAVIGAIGMFVQPQDLDPTKPDPKRTWVSSKMVPFAGRMITEKLACDGKQDAYVRLLVNDAVQKVPACSDDNGLCSLPAFLESQQYSQENGQGEWELCFETT